MAAWICRIWHHEWRSAGDHYRTCLRCRQIERCES